MRFYGVDLEAEIDSIDSARFFKRAYRLPAYDGAIAARAHEEHERMKKRQPAKALRENPQAKVVNDVADLGDIVDLRN